MNDIMAQLAALIGGQQVSTGAVMPQMAVPRPVQPIAPLAGEQPYTYPDGVDSGKGDGKGDGKGGGKGNGKPSRYDKAANKATVRGPSKYTDVMKKNVGLGNKTIGYGLKPLPQRTGMTRLLDLFAPSKTGPM